MPALSRTTTLLLEMIAPELASGEGLPLQQLAQQMGYSSRTSVHNHLGKLVRAGLIVRIGFGRYVAAGDPRAGNPLALGEVSFSRPKADAKPVRKLPAMVPGLTLQRLMAGR